MRRYSTVLAVSILLHLSAFAGDTLSIVLTGDILLDRGVRRTINQYGVDRLFSDGTFNNFHDMSSL